MALKTIKQFVNESKHLGKDIYPEYCSKYNFGKIVKNVKDLVKGDVYILHEPGMDSWQCEYKYNGIVKGMHEFASDVQGSKTDDILSYSQKDLEAMCYSGKVFNFID